MQILLANYGFFIHLTYCAFLQTFLSALDDVLTETDQNVKNLNVFNTAEKKT